MNMINTVDEARIYRRNQLIEEQIELAEAGISSALEGNQVVTIGNADCDYISAKHFLLAQVTRLGIKRFLNATNETVEDFIDNFAELEIDNDDWFDVVENYFDGMRGDY